MLPPAALEAPPSPLNPHALCWQSAIAASPASAHKGYLLGGLVWFTIPFALATSLGLAGNALNVKLDATEAGRGLVPPAAATVMMGKGGGTLRDHPTPVLVDRPNAHPKPTNPLPWYNPDQASS